MLSLRWSGAGQGHQPRLSGDSAKERIKKDASEYFTIA